MRFMITAGPGPEGTPRTEEALSDQLFDAHMKFNEEMAKAGVLIASEGLLPEGARARVVVSGGKRTFLDGPFAETKELLGGFYLIDVTSREEAIQWALRCPVGLGFDDVLLIYQMTDLADIPLPYRERIAQLAPTWTRQRR